MRLTEREAQTYFTWDDDVSAANSRADYFLGLRYFDIALR